MIRRFRFASLVAASAAIVVSSVAAACSDDAAPASPADAGVDVTPVRPIATSPPPPADAGPLTCATDVGDDGLPNRLSCAQLYSDFAARTVAAGILPYTPAVEFWSDGAEKQRWVYLPPATKIDISSFDEWKFPVGTRFYKQFKVDGVLVETRMFAKLDTGWQHTTYLWNDDGSDAVRNDDGKQIPRDGGPPYEVPNTSNCTFCHNGRVEPVLGFQALALGLDGATGLTLPALADAGALSAVPPATSFKIPDDVPPGADAGLASGALGWLHANCGHCHNTNAGAGAFGATLKMLIKPSDLLVDGGASVTDLAAYRTGYCQASDRNDPDGGAFYLFFTGGPSGVANSLAAILLGSRAPADQQPNILNQMPPLVTHRVDPVGQKKVDDWITALPPCP